LKKSLIFFDFFADDDPLDFEGMDFSFFRFSGAFSSGSVASFELAYADFIFPMLTLKNI
jgi:hypothetical protein